MFTRPLIVAASAIVVTSSTLPGASVVSAEIEFGVPVEVDLGPRWCGDEVLVELALHNPTATDLAVDQVAFSCGCVRAQEDIDLIPAQGSAEYEVLFHTPFTPGPWRSRIIINPEDEGVEPWIITLVTDISVPLVAVPPRVDFGPLNLGESEEPRRRTTELTNGTDATLEITVTAVTPESFSTPVDELTIPRGGTAPLEILIDPTARVGPIRGSVTLHVGHEKLEEIVVATQAIVIGRVLLNPRTVWFGRATAGERHTQSLRVTSRAASDFHVLGAEIDWPGFSVATEELRRGLYEVTVALEATTEASHVIETHLRLLTDDPTEPEIVVGVAGMLVAAPEP